MNLDKYIPVTHNDDFWTHDIPLFPVALPYYHNKPRMVQGKIHLSEEKYLYDKYEIIPLRMKPGETCKRTYVMMHPYILEPEMFISIGLYPKPKQYADQSEVIGETLSSPQEKGMRQNQVGNAQAWYYPQDKVIVLWECFFDRQIRNIHSLTEDMYMPKLWKSFEHWLSMQFPDATRIVTPFNDPIAQSIEEYQTFLRSLDYQPSEKAVFSKTLMR
jgi:hypothetical protein